jgi:glycosyltransferase involved in cell wall biosynthesis
VLSSQTYGPRDEVPGKSLRLAIMHASNNNIKWISDVSQKDMNFSCGRNTACELTLNSVDAGEEVDYIVWVDSDIVLEPGTLTRLIWTAAGRGLDFVTGIYHQKSDEAKPVIYDCQKKWWPLSTRFQSCVNYPENTIAPMGGCGFGIVVTSVKMIQEMRKSRHWSEIGKWFPDTRDVKGGAGEDLNFCKLAIWCGYQLYVHTGIQVGHQGKGRIYTREDFQKRKEKAILESGVLRPAPEV